MTVCSGKAPVSVHADGIAPARTHDLLARVQASHYGTFCILMGQWSRGLRTSLDPIKDRHTVCRDFLLLTLIEYVKTWIAPSATVDFCCTAKLTCFETDYLSLSGTLARHYRVS